MTDLTLVADAIDAARYAHPEHPRERPRPFAEADRGDREYAFRLARAAIAALPPLRAREEIARHLQTLDDLFHGLAREYRGYLPDSERGFGTADSRTREMRIEDDTKKFRAAHDALSSTAGQEWRAEAREPAEKSALQQAIDSGASDEM